VLTQTGERTCLEVILSPKTTETYLLIFLPAAYITCVHMATRMFTETRTKLDDE